jgi:peptidoglycan hydrolase CwlO-like protein
VNAQLAVEVLLGLLTAVVAVAAFFSAQKANQAQARAQVTAVDAAAYGRAKAIYESAIEALQSQTADLHEQVEALSTEVDRLRTANNDLSGEVGRLRSANSELKRKITVLERRQRGNP